MDKFARYNEMKYIRNFLKGMAVGIATLVPGVSGGTMAVILGIYDKLIHAVSSFFQAPKKHAAILLEIGLGGITGIALFSKLLEKAIKTYPAIMQFLFIGIIIGGLPVLYKKSGSLQKRNKKDIIFLILGFIIVLLMSSEPEAAATMATSQGITSIVFLFLGGFIIAIALVLPGISASFMLYTLGLYGITLNAINTVNVPYLVPLGVGLAAGTLGTAKIIERFLQKHPSKTYMLIIGFVIGSLIPIFPKMPSGSQLLVSAAAFVLGFILILLLGKNENFA